MLTHKTDGRRHTPMSPGIKVREGSITMTLKSCHVCWKCGENKPWNSEYFYVGPKTNKPKYLCLLCAKKIQRVNDMAKNYDLTEEQYEKMLFSQNYSCAICFTSEWGGKTGVPHVDHNHETGKVRGLLCHGCNTAIGLLKESEDTIMSALNYIKERG